MTHATLPRRLCGFGLLLGLVSAVPATAVQTLSETGVFGFTTDFLSYRNATSRGWNFGDSAANAPTVSLLGVTLAGNTGVNDAATGLAYTTAPLTYAITGFTWAGTSEQAARDNLSKGGLHGGTGFFALNLAATPGAPYVLDILALDRFAPAGGRVFDVLVDGVMARDDWTIPVGSPYNRVLRLRVVADADGIDLRFDRGAGNGNPAISALALTRELPEPPVVSALGPSQTQPLGGSARLGATLTGPAPFACAWRRNGSVVTNTPGATLVLHPLTAGDAGVYDVVVSNAYGSVTSTVATVEVVTPYTPGSGGILQDLAGYWRFDETQGLTAADTSGFHHSGNLVNVAPGSGSQWTAGRVGGALRLDGPASAQHVVVPDFPKAADAYTLSAWVWADSRPAWASIAKNWLGQFHFGLDAAGGQLGNYLALNGGGVPFAREAAALPTGSWQHVACTVGDASIRIYRNGLPVATTAYTGAFYPTPPAALAIGAKLTGTVADSFWHGRMDDLALWRRALSGDEIFQLFAAGLAGEEIALAAPRPPVLLAQTRAQTQAAGGRAVFSVTAAGGDGVTYQWRRDGQAVTHAAAQAAVLTLDPLTPADAGAYDVVVANAAGSVTGAVMRLDVIAPLAAAETGIRRELAGYWRFDETQGTTAADSSGRHNTGELVNFPADNNAHRAAGRVGGALRFAGTASAQHVVVADFPKTTAAYTLSAWVRAESRPVWASIAKNWFGEFHFGLDAANGQPSNYVGLSGGGSAFARDPAVLPLDTWQHVACAVDGAAVRVYRNGRLTGMTTYTGSAYPTPPQALAIGAKLTGAVADSFWHGSIDDLALWNRALSEAEIAALFIAGSTGADISQAEPPAPPAGLVINEYLADNAGGAEDEDRDSSDWIEILNGTAAPVNLDGYFLSDDPLNPAKWRFPAVTLAAGQHLLVWASGKDRRVAGQPLHTSFQLAAAGEDLQLTAPDGVSVVHRYGNPFSPPPASGAAWYPSEPNVSVGLRNGGADSAWFPFPTPGEPNIGPLDPRGAVIDANAHLPAQPLPGEDLVITARIRADQPGAAPTNLVTGATLFARIMHGPESAWSMTDDGTGGDAVAGDGVWSATLPATPGAAAGRMVRWRIEAGTSAGFTGRSPRFLRPDAPEYLGTVVADPGLATPLPVIHRFTADTAAAETLGGARAEIFHDGEFHDNCLLRIRGNSSLLWPKKSHKVEFPKGHGFLLRPGLPRVDEFDLNSTYSDKSYARAPLVSEMIRLAGLPCPEVFPVHVRQNGEFHAVAHLVEQPDGDFLARHGLDPDGALYKAVGDTVPCRLDDAAALEKKNRPDEGNADLAALVAALNLPAAALETWMFDNLDVPAVVNFMATVAVSQGIDASNKNYFMYRDSDRSREWMFLPWDLDLTLGPNALNTDVIVATQSDPSVPACASHPFIGARPWLLQATKFNRLQEEIVRNPRTRAMLQRRIRSLSDRFLATGWFATRLDELHPLLEADVAADRARWGANAHFNWTGGGVVTLRQAMDRIRDEHLAPRLAYLTVTHAAPETLDFATGLGRAGIPGPQAAPAALAFGAHDANPAGGNQDQEFVELVNPGAESVDISGWTLSGGISFTFRGGTVIPAGGSAHVTPDRHAFRQRADGPRGGENRLVLGDADGHLGNFGETVELRDPEGVLVATLVTAANPSDAQRWLRMTEIDYHPPGDGLAEFVELQNLSTNVTLDLAGVRFSDGVEFAFAPGDALAPGAFALVVRDLAAFTARHGGGLPVTGVFQNASSLANGGERVALDDATGSTIQEVGYGDLPPWPAAADGAGASLHFVAGSWGPPEAARWFALPPSPGARAGDADGDGADDLAEFIAGTRPGDAASVLRLTPLATATNGVLRLVFPLAADKTCAVQAAAEPAGSWTTLHAEPAGVARTVDLPVTSSARRVYFRLVTPAP